MIVNLIESVEYACFYTVLCRKNKLLAFLFCFVASSVFIEVINAFSVTAGYYSAVNYLIGFITLSIGELRNSLQKISCSLMPELITAAVNSFLTVAVSFHPGELEDGRQPVKENCVAVHYLYVHHVVRACRDTSLLFLGLQAVQPLLASAYPVLYGFLVFLDPFEFVQRFLDGVPALGESSRMGQAGHQHRHSKHRRYANE